MASNARIFFAGVGTTFVILGVGFGCGAFVANSALKDPTQQARTSAEPPIPVRVILPASAETAQPPQNSPQTPQQVTAAEPAPEPVKAVMPEKRVDKLDTERPATAARERRKRYTERKAKREATRAKQRFEPGEEVPVMAFGGEPRQSGLNLLGN